MESQKKQAWVKDAELSACLSAQGHTKVTPQLSEHQAVRCRQKRRCWKHRKQQMVGPRAAGMASSVITFSCSLGFPELGVWGSQRLEGRQLRVTGMLCRKARQRGSACCFLPLYKALCWSYANPLCLWSSSGTQRPALALPLLRALRLQTRGAILVA